MEREFLVSTAWLELRDSLNTTILGFQLLSDDVLRHSPTEVLHQRSSEREKFWKLTTFFPLRDRSALTAALNTFSRMREPNCCGRDWPTWLNRNDRLAQFSCVRHPSLGSTELPAADCSLFVRDCWRTRGDMRGPTASPYARVGGLEQVHRACQLVGFTLAGVLAGCTLGGFGPNFWLCAAAPGKHNSLLLPTGPKTHPQLLEEAGKSVA
jgi:hypothetical protein